jgi:hypothetical protein
MQQKGLNMRLRSSIVALSLAASAAAAFGQALPEGNTGIAARYPNDAGITADAAVIFADDFESYGSASQLTSKWSEAYHNVRIATDAASVFKGSKALELSIPQQSGEVSNTAAKQLVKKEDVLFFRYYSKFDNQFNVLGSSHNGASINAQFYNNGQSTPGIPANGTNKFLVALESWRDTTSVGNPGNLNVYVYHPEQRSQWGDHWFPGGLILPFGGDPKAVFGQQFITRPDTVPELGRWYSYEFMVKANTPGLRDGRVAIWLDGKLVGDFTNLRLRDIDTLKIDRFSLEFHVKNNSLAPAKKYYDNVVVARSYIGPVSTSPAATVPLAAPTGLRVQ